MITDTATAFKQEVKTLLVKQKYSNVEFLQDMIERYEAGFIGLAETGNGQDRVHGRPPCLAPEVGCRFGRNKSGMTMEG